MFSVSFAQPVENCVENPFRMWKTRWENHVGKAVDNGGKLPMTERMSEEFGGVCGIFSNRRDICSVLSGGECLV